MGMQSFDDEIAQVPSRDGADRHFAPNSPTFPLDNSFIEPQCVLGQILV